MDRVTVAIYDERGEAWAARRKPVRRDDALEFGAMVEPGAMRLDAGAGAGRYTNELGEPVVALDASRTMLRQLGDVAPHALRVLADLEALPLRRGSIHGTWANMSYLHVPRVHLPRALADLHRTMTVGAPFEIQVLLGDHEGHDHPQDDVGGRFFAAWGEQQLVDVLTGAGFEIEPGGGPIVADYHVRARCRRAGTLPDTVGPNMRLLVCGLNPSIYSADRGVGFARPGNRFWRAAIEAGIVSRPYDPAHALTHHGVGMTDLCKRATVASSELTKDEYRAGAQRVERLVEWLQPRAIAFVGLEGWRAAIDRKAAAGPQPKGFGGRPAYVLPSTSGLNARTPLAEVAAHLRAAADQ